MKKITVFLAGIIIAGSGFALRAEVTYSPVADITFSGGQYFLEGDPSSFGGNSGIYFAPGLSFSGGSSLIPVISLTYSGTQDIQELVGGGTLTRERADMGATLKYVTKLSRTETKLRGSYKKSLINETKDENWTEGLFDYDRILFGAQSGREVMGHDFTLGVDYYTVKFPNYASLISQSEDEFETAIDTYTHTEISKNAGTNVLDYSNIKMDLSASSKYTENLSASYGYAVDLRNYSDQTIVKKNGSFSSDKRSDIVNTLNAALDYRQGRAVIGLGGSLSLLNSNQNSYDADATKYIDNYYSYIRGNISPSVALYLGAQEKLSRLKLWWNIDLTKYAGRLAREDDADYTSDKVKQADNSLGLSYGYPITESLTADAGFSYRVASSNMKYEGNYKYNYSATNYYAGLNWQY